MRLVVPLAACVLASEAHAASTVDLIEHLFGASNVNGVVGNGRMTVGISATGDGSVLSWPSPSYCDQLLHLGRNDLDVRAGANLAAAESMGTFIGVRVTTAAGTSVVFPRSDDGWTITQSFPDARTAAMRTVFTKPGAGFDIVVEDRVAVASDVWLRRVTVTPTTTGTTNVEVLGYWNLSPTVSRVPQLPLADWAMDAYNDYAAVWSEADHAVIHYRPEGRGDIASITDLVVRPAIDFGPIGAALARGPVDADEAAALAAGLADEPEGVYLAVTSEQPIVGHQVGFDETPVCDLLDVLADNIKALPTVFAGLTLPLDPALVDVLRCDITAAGTAAENGWTDLPKAAFADLADGVLDGANAAAGQVDVALAVTARPENASFVATFRVGAASTAKLALATATDEVGAPDEGADTIFDHVLSLPATTHLPKDTAVAEVASRALVNLMLAQDANTGAIVASVSRQAPYALDWPRDGAFFTAALDVAGLSDRASRRVPWLLAAQRTTPVAAEPLINSAPPIDPDDGETGTYPAGAWEMNYYADGLPGGNIRWEIDNTGLVVWSLVDHAHYLEGAERAAHETQIFPAVARAADLLARWKDPSNNLQALASEDDNAVYTQTLHGAITTWAALDAAQRLAAARPDLDVAGRAPVWSARADELRQAILEHLVDPVTHRFEEGLNEANNPGNAAGGPSARALWPARFLRSDVPAEVAIREATEAWLLELAEARLDPKNGGSAYLAKLLVAVAIATEDPDRKAKARVLLQRLATTTSSPDTHVFGEVFVGYDSDGDGTADAFSPRVSNPHVWAGTLVYLAAMALDAPERFDDPLAPPPEPVTSEGGGCSGAGANLLPLLALAALVSRRRTC